MRWVLLLMTVLLATACAGKARPVQMAREKPSATFIPRVHFAFSSAVLDDESKSILLKNVEWMHEHPRAVFVLEGHCDEHGDESFNRELGDRRARAVLAFLLSQGIDAQRSIVIASYGETRPLDARHTADAWRKNRRVEFVLR